jgi:hypothetical protein
MILFTTLRSEPYPIFVQCTETNLCSPEVSSLARQQITIHTDTNCNPILPSNGAHGTVVLKVQCYKLEGHGSETQWGEWIFPIYLILPAALGHGICSASNNEMSARSRKIMILGGKAWPVCRADCLDTVGSLTSHNPIGLHGLLQG